MIFFPRVNEATLAKKEPYVWSPSREGVERAEGLAHAARRSHDVACACQCYCRGISCSVPVGLYIMSRLIGTGSTLQFVREADKLQLKGQCWAESQSP